MKSMSGVGNNVGNPDGNSEVERTIISYVLEDPAVSAFTISEKTSYSQRTIERGYAKLKEKGIIERVGGTRGKWIVKK